jgi:hypothetical protein
MLGWILLFFIIDTIVVLVVVWWFMNRRRQLVQQLHGPSLEQVTGFARDVEPQIREYMAANYAGDPATLAQVLPALASRLETQARASGLELGRETIEAIVAKTIAGQRVAREREVHRAFEDARARLTP